MVMQSRNAALRPGLDSLSKPAGRRPKAVPAWRGPRDFHDMQQLSNACSVTDARCKSLQCLLERIVRIEWRVG